MEKNKKNISARKIVFHLNSLGLGGAEQVVTTLANYFVNQGDKIYIATEWVSQEEYKIDKRIERVHVGLTVEQEKVNSKIQFFIRIKNLRDFIKRVHPDIVISFAQAANYRAMMATQFLKTPVMISVRTDPYLNYTGFRDKVFIPLFLSKAAGSVFQTENARNFFPSKLKKHSRIILNPINDKYLNREKPQKRREAVVHSGRLVDCKNQQLLIDAFLKVHQRYPEYKLEIYGGNSEDGTEEALQQSIMRNHADNYIFLMGESSNLEKQLIDGAVYAFSSDWEGLPNALMEAMALGLPVVATDCPCGGPRTLIQNGENGILVPVKNVDAMAEAIMLLIENKELAEELGKNARKISEIANSEAICCQWREYIEELCEHK